MQFLFNQPIFLELLQCSRIGPVSKWLEQNLLGLLLAGWPLTFLSPNQQHHSIEGYWNTSNLCYYRIVMYDEWLHWSLYLVEWANLWDAVHISVVAVLWVELNIFISCWLACVLVVQCGCRYSVVVRCSLPLDLSSLDSVVVFITSIETPSVDIWPQNWSSSYIWQWNILL